MTTTITLQKDYDSLNKILNFLKDKTHMKCEIRRDPWNMFYYNTLSRNEILVIRKGNVAAKISFNNSHTIQIEWIFWLWSIRIPFLFWRILDRITKDKQNKIIEEIITILNTIKQ